MIVWRANAKTVSLKLSILDPLSGNVRSKYSQPEIQYATMLSRGPHSLAPATPCIVAR